MTDTVLYDGEVTLRFSEKAHRYSVIEGGRSRFCPGVTTILGIWDKPALVHWSASCAVEYLKPYIGKPITQPLLDDAKKNWRKVAKDASDIGTQAHAFAEAYAKGEKPKVPDGPAGVAATAFMRWAESAGLVPQSVERKIYSKKHHFAGTVDLVAEADSQLCVIDYKTSKAPRDGNPYKEWLLQLAAYSMAIEEEDGRAVDRRFIVRFPKEEGDSISVYEATDLQWDNEGFLRTLACYRWEKGIKT